jgi:glycosyltransferase involved in cell wall biosynthesis
MHETSVSAWAGSRLQIAVLVPCFNEATTIATVIRDFRAALPQAVIYVFDNNSSDGTAEIALAMGAEVRREPRQGKGHVVRRMFADIDADIYLLVDGDATYEAGAARKMISLMVDEHLDFVNGARVAVESGAYRPAHQFGNRLLTGAVRAVFGRDFTDMLSGYKLFSRRYVTCFPAISRGFEIETEFTIHALELQMPCAEVPTDYRERPAGSASVVFWGPRRHLNGAGANLRHPRPDRIFRDGTRAAIPNSDSQR